MFIFFAYIDAWIPMDMEDDCIFIFICSFRSQGDAILTQFEAYLDTHQALDEDIHFLLFFENHLKHNGCHTCGGGRRVVLRWWLCRAWQLLDHVAGGICAPWHTITASPWYKKLGGGFILKIFSPLFREDSHFDDYFSNGVGWNHQPTRKRRENLTFLRISTLNSMGVNHHEVRAYLGGSQEKVCPVDLFSPWKSGRLTVLFLFGLEFLTWGWEGGDLFGRLHMYICIYAYIYIYMYVHIFLFPG